jgi:hypothetical protein
MSLIGNGDCPGLIAMRRPCTVIQMPERRVQEIVCRCWPELHAGRFVTAGSLTQLGRLIRFDAEPPRLLSLELAERPQRSSTAGAAGCELIPFADRRTPHHRANDAVAGNDDGPFDDVA